MEVPKQEENKLVQGLEEEQEQQEQVTGKNRQNLNERLIASSKKNQYQQVQKCLKKKADINYEENTKKKWNALIWACCMGHVKIVKLLLSRGAGQPYMEIKPQNRHIVIGSTKQLKPNPLHWSCFKGHLDITQILLKAGFHWEDIDGSGNNSVMLAAAGNSVDIFKTFLQYGVSISCKNSRGHIVKDLTTHHEILALTNKYENSKECAISKTPFLEKQIKYWCWVCTQFVNSQNFKMQWTLKNLNATQKQKIDGRCKKCWSQNYQITKQLQDAIQKYQQSNLKRVLDKYNKNQNQIQITFLAECLRILNKLKVQNQILNFIKSLSKIQNYKIILKSVNKIHQMLKDAQQIHIDVNVIQLAQKEIERLNAERNLRFQIDNIDTSVATRQGVAKLDQIYNIAQKCGVASQYLQVAEAIKSKMKRSILAQDLYQQFVDYPLRPDPYPEPLVIDFKSKKPLDPQTKKPTDPVNLLPKKKKGKKSPVFQIPEWANDLKQMNQKIKECQQLLNARQQLGLGKQFCVKTEQIITLMKRQSRYRKDMDTLQAMVDQANKKKK